MSSNKPPRNDALWPWIIATIIYVGFGVFVLYQRWEEIGSLLDPPASPAVRLSLNSIGDIAAGFFAPLAFMWLFVATQLQRNELRLQRKELEETRAVLRDQKEELERSAKESNHQTSIMQKTLDATRSRIIYEDFNLRLYFLGRMFYKIGNIYMYSVPEDKRLGFALYVYQYKEFDQTLQVNPSSVDVFFEKVSVNLEKIVAVIRKGDGLDISSDYADLYSQFFKTAIPELRRMMSTSDYEGSDLIVSRIDGLNLLGILANLDLICAVAKINRPLDAADF